jgi:rhodanese-related sulfurtransferase
MQNQHTSRIEETVLERMRSQLPAVLAMVTLVVFCGCTSESAYHHISVAEFNSMVADDPSVFLLDVREPHELVETGAIPNVLNIPLGELEGRLNELPSDTTATIISICKSGNRSKVAADILVRNGYSSVYSLDGGTVAWLSDQKAKQ